MAGKHTLTRLRNFFFPLYRKLIEPLPQELNCTYLHSGIHSVLKTVFQKLPQSPFHKVISLLFQFIAPAYEIRWKVIFSFWLFIGPHSLWCQVLSGGGGTAMASRPRSLRWSQVLSGEGVPPGLWSEVPSLVSGPRSFRGRGTTWPLVSGPFQRGGTPILSCPPSSPARTGWGTTPYCSLSTPSLGKDRIGVHLLRSRRRISC